LAKLTLFSNEQIKVQIRLEEDLVQIAPIQLAKAVAILSKTLFLSGRANADHRRCGERACGRSPDP